MIGWLIFGAIAIAVTVVMVILVIASRKAADQVAKLEAEKMVQSFRTEALEEAAKKNAKRAEQAAREQADLSTATNEELERRVNE